MASALIILAFVVVFPFLTYYATSTLFFRKVNSTSVAKRPPTIPYFIPGLFHAASFAQLGARKYFAELIKDYGDFAPFKVRAGPHTYVVLRDAVQMKRVLEASEHMSATPTRVEMVEKLFGSPRAANQVTISEAGSRDDAAFHLSDSDLASITKAYISVLSSNMHDKMFQLDTWTGIEDLWSFLQLVILRCTSDTLFGSALLKQYPRMVRDYLEFNTAIEGFVHGMPSIMLFASTKSRDCLHQGIGNWLKAKSPAFDIADVPEWDQNMGSRFVRKHYNACQTDEDGQISLGSRAAEVLRIIHTVNKELAPSTFWLTVEILRKSHLVRSMKANIDQYFSATTNDYDVLGLTQVPFVQSIQAEVRRLRTATCVIRTNKTDGFPLDKHWSLPKGATVAMFSQDVSLNTDVWKKSQPQALERPLEEFWAERFTRPERKNQRRKDAGVELATEGLGDLVTSLTTCDEYPGSRLTSALQIATLVVLFTDFELQLSDVDEVDAVLPPVREFAYGTVKPLDKVAVRIRKRKI
ncbi:cytochrome P450 [Lizonia empirigonia]|nr:cytochrome P450 [Lizonia empirigonia]